ncbi:MAG: hypothetical protein RBT75_18155 [Anaerolineae bacterium]|jgi:hypothetical protein|nr:hypothetical protein [Anaerolineae bacterium]
MTSRHDQSLLSTWFIQVFSPGGSARHLWRATVVFFLLLNLLLLSIWQGNFLRILLSEWGKIYDVVSFTPIKTEDITVFLYGPTVLVETIPGQIEVQIHNSGARLLHDVRVVLSDSKGNIRVSGGTVLPNLLQVTNLPPGTDCTQIFELTVLENEGQTLPHKLNLSVAYNPIADSSQDEVIVQLDNAYTFQSSRISQFHRVLRKVNNISRRSTEMINEWRLLFTALFSALGGFVMALVINPVNWLRKLYSQIRNFIKNGFPQGEIKKD